MIPVDAMDALDFRIVLSHKYHAYITSLSNYRLTSRNGSTTVFLNPPFLCGAVAASKCIEASKKQSISSLCQLTEKT